MFIAANVFLSVASLILPVSAGVWLAVRRKGYLKPALLGAVCFGFFQAVTRLPALELLRQTIGYTIFSTTRPYLNALFLAGTAGLFEEGGRWLVMSLLMKDKRRVSDGLAFGVGHGGLEALLINGISSVVFLILNDYSTTTPTLLVAGGFERVCTIAVHMALSVMVLKSVSMRKSIWLLLAFVLHTAIDLTVVLLPQAGASIILSEAAILAFALLSLCYIIMEYNKYRGGEFTCQTAAK